jgi:carbon storage regulator
MLVLSRKLNERIVVRLGGEIVTIEILKIAGNRVRVGVDAPSHVAVHRQELWNRIATELESAHRGVTAKYRAIA